MTDTPDPMFGVFSLVPDPTMSGRRAAVQDMTTSDNYTAAAADEKAAHYRGALGAGGQVDIEEWEARSKFWQAYADTVRQGRFIDDSGVDTPTVRQLATRAAERSDR